MKKSEFNQKKAIRAWRKELKRQQGLEPGVIEELEGHLRDKIEDLIQKGYTPEQAFLNSIEGNFDKPEEIADEFYQARKTKTGPPPWKHSSWVPALLPNFIKVALRNFSRDRTYSLINLLGLAFGIASCLIILLHVQLEFSYDQFHTKKDRIYRVNQSYIWGDHNDQFSSTGPAVAHALSSELPGIESTLRIHTPADFIVTVENGTKQTYEELDGLLADSTFFGFFSFHLIQGNPNTVLTKPNSVVLTEETALKYFQETDVVGREITIKSGSLNKSYRVTGIVENPPVNSHFDFSMLASMSSFPNVKNRESSWVWTTFVTYILLEENASVENLTSRLPGLMEKHAGRATNALFGLSYEEYVAKEGPWNLYLQPLTDIWLYSGEAGNRLGETSDIIYVYVFSTIAVLIILLACINFMNLSTARSVKRAKEVGIRKTLGSGKKELIFQFLGESVFFSLLSAVLGIILAALCIPWFNRVLGEQIDSTLMFSPVSLAGIVAFAVIIGITVGIYPAFFLTSFRPSNVLKGKIDVSSANKKLSLSNLRNALVVFQFAVSICLIISSLFIYKQLDYIQNKDLGFNKDRLLVLQNAELLQMDEETFSQVLKDYPGVEKVSYSNAFPPQIWYEDYYTAYGSSEPAVAINGLLADEEFLNTLEVSFLKGRGFSKERPSDVEGVILNEAAVQRLNWNIENPNPDFPIGEYLQYGDIRFKVTGIIEDFNYRSLYTNVPPLAVFHKDSKAWFGPRAFFTIRLTDNADISSTLAKIETYWKRNFPEAPFKYAFVNDVLEWQYEADQKAGSVFGVFTFLAIFIACLGLLGLIAFVVERRTKEIGIRKVMGASVRDILLMLSSDFAKLISLSFVLAIPASYYLMQYWLQDFEYKIQLDPLIFIVGGCIALVIALGTLSFQTLQAAFANPIKSLKSE